jgi:hypothetical protein
MEFAVPYGKLLIGYSAILSVTLTLYVAGSSRKREDHLFRPPGLRGFRMGEDDVGTLDGDLLCQACLCWLFAYSSLVRDDRRRSLCPARAPAEHDRYDDQESRHIKVDIHLIPSRRCPNVSMPKTVGQIIRKVAGEKP